MKFKFKNADKKKSIVEDVEDREDLEAIAKYEEAKAKGDVSSRPISELWKELHL